jgi:UDP-N-acetylmuramoyl-tripeptide--D-alanyl-D-alanine ligase
MGEVGSQGPQMHIEMAAYARDCGVDRLLLLGDLASHAAPAFGDQAQHFGCMSDLQAAVLQAMPQQGSLLVKGSRFMKMEQLVHAIKAAVTEGQHASV